VVLGVRPDPGDREPNKFFNVIRVERGACLIPCGAVARMCARKGGVKPDCRDTEQTTGH
jgi:hypothetical protein